METAKPLISILMAVYEPRMDWLKEQLNSLNAQTYPNLRLYVRDDCSPTVPYEAVEACVKECITAFPYTVQRNEKNTGSNLTFERLTVEAEGEYFAYCDQDDIWLPGKLALLQAELERSGALLVCSDMYIIDADGRQVADSITKVRRRHKFCSGQQVFNTLLVRNFVVGCTMLVTRETAVSAVPFIDEMVHDHWIALWAASKGEVRSIASPLIFYRIHGGNQTGTLAGINTKSDYITFKIQHYIQRMHHIERRIVLPKEVQPIFPWLEARYDYAGRKKHAGQTMWRLKYLNPATTLFELFAMRLPDFLFQWLLCIIKKSG